MELEENKISISTIKQYLQLIIHDLGKFTHLEFLTLKGWLLYSLSLVTILCIPCMAILIITGLISGNIPLDLLIAISLIPFIFILPLTLTLTFINNYKRPKTLRKYILQGLGLYLWDSPPKKVSQTAFECIKEGKLFRIEVCLLKNEGKEDWFTCMIIPYYIPKSIKDKEQHIENVNRYLSEKCIFEIKQDMAFFTIPVKVFPKLDLNKSIEELLYAMRRFDLRTSTFYNPTAILNKVPNTLEILAMTVFDMEIDEKWITWSKNMIKADFVNKNMQDFASQIPCIDNQKDLRKRMDILICEFNLDINKEYILLNYLRFLLFENYHKRRTVLEVIQCLSQLYIHSKISLLRDFDLLYRAKKEIDETGKQVSWKRDTLEPKNIDSYIINYLDTLSKTGILSM